ncbi:hypothetical protein HAT2_00377 [Candidatus Similichlamydia laticola]|uniref:Uncharacterized protein n=2 Tax=Candidatus Similichlamydia laticola TaxID=2170265 RepID=A0A369KI85_9BACT|nr:hypothetical protein HAT2_00377 [Candidatus Similichlamydia laticola]
MACSFCISPNFVLGEAPVFSSEHDSSNTVLVPEVNEGMALLVVRKVIDVDDLMSWTRKAAEEERCLVVLLSSDISIFEKLSESGLKKLRKECHILQSEKATVGNGFSIPLDLEGEEAVAVFACPVADRNSEDLILIHWVILTGKTEVFADVMHSSTSARHFFEKLNGKLKEQVPLVETEEGAREQ